MAAGRIYNFAFFLLTFYFLKLIDQFESIMQNKPNLLNAQMNVTFYLTKHYENDNTFRLPENKANTNPIQSQNKPNPRKAKNERNFYFNKGL